MNTEFVLTSDGSHTLFVPELNEHYHSVYGAIQESKHVFIQAGLHFFGLQKERINILEVGFGAGLNAFLTFIETQNLKNEIHYTAIEPYPLNEKIITQLNYPSILGNENLFFLLHKADWCKTVKLSAQSYITKFCTKIQDYKTDSKFDIVYFDAFAPEVQPEIWTEVLFKKLFGFMNDGAILTTYSVKGTVRRTLKKVGFIVEKLPGPSGKREITRAIKYQ